MCRGREQAERSSPSVRTVHVLLKPGLEISQLMLHSVHHLHGCMQVATAQAVVDHSPHRVAFYLTVLLCKLDRVVVLFIYFVATA